MTIQDAPTLCAAALARQHADGDGMPRRQPMLTGDEEQAALVVLAVALPLLIPAYFEMEKPNA